MTDPKRPSVRSAHLDGLRSWGIRRVHRRTLVKPGTAPASEEQQGLAPTAAPHEPPAPQTAPVSSAPDATMPQPETPSVPTNSNREPAAATSDVANELARCAEEVAACTRCGLSETRNRTVYGVGAPNARLMFVGEAPGRDEDLQGEPFVGRAGQLLNKIIGALGLEREDVYIANVLKCRPPNNRDPQPQEVGCCTPFLMRQIELVAPEMIVALGRPAANFLLDSQDSLARLRGRLHRYEGIPLVATYHPAYLLRNPDAKKKVWQDLQVVIQDLKLPGPPQRGAPARGS